METAAEFESKCPSTYPPALRKACCDPFTYALELSSGQCFRFASAEIISPEWVHIVGGGADQLGFLRGVDVRVADIIWVADAGR
jgi:hypothetical protein